MPFPSISTPKTAHERVKRARLLLALFTNRKYRSKFQRFLVVDAAGHNQVTLATRAFLNYLRSLLPGVAPAIKADLKELIEAVDRLADELAIAHSIPRAINGSDYALPCLHAHKNLMGVVAEWGVDSLPPGNLDLWIEMRDRCETFL